MQRIVLLLASMVAGVLLLASGMLPSITYGQTTTASFTDVSAEGSQSGLASRWNGMGVGLPLWRRGATQHPRI
jgi:hypothetical protein